MIPQNKRWLIQNLGIQATAGSGFQILLDGLSLRELAVLRKHEDLVDRVKEITKMNEAALISTLQEDYDLEVQNLHSGDVWVGTNLIEDNIPDWFESTHCGWYLDLREGEFHKWARELLMQEVRVNIWMRYLEHKKKNPTITVEPIHPGMYL